MTAAVSNSLALVLCIVLETKHAFGSKGVAVCAACLVFEPSCWSHHRQQEQHHAASKPKPICHRSVTATPYSCPPQARAPQTPGAQCEAGGNPPSAQATTETAQEAAGGSTKEAVEGAVENEESPETMEAAWLLAAMHG